MDATNRQLAAKAIIEIARQYLAECGGMSSSAALCFEDAHRCFSRGDFDAASSRALRSLKYSVGILSDVYKNACEIIGLARYHNSFSATVVE